MSASIYVVEVRPTIGCITDWTIYLLDERGREAVVVDGSDDMAETIRMAQDLAYDLEARVRVVDESGNEVRNGQT